MTNSIPPAGSFRFPLVITITSAVFLLLVSTSLFAQFNEYNWRQTNEGLFGATATAFGFAPNGNVVLGTTRGLYLLPEGEDRWQKREVEGSVFEIATSPSGAILASTENGTYRSTDDGLSWTRVFTVSGQYHFFFNGSSGIVYAGQQGFLGPSGYYFRSTDDGLTWETVWWNGDIYGGNNWLAVNHRGEMLLSADSGLLVSRNNGQSWEPTELRLHVTRLLPLSNEVMFAATSEGIWKSTDGGITWNRIDTIEVNDFQIASNGDYYYRYSSPYGYRGHILGGLSRSTDVGTSRSTILHLSDVTGFGLAPDGTIWAGGNGTVLRSTNNGNSWERFDRGLHNIKVGRLIYNHADHLYALIATGKHPNATGDPSDFYALHRSSDNGSTWTYLKDSLSTELLEADGYGNLYCSRSNVSWQHNGNIYERRTTTSILQSTDDGQTWQEIAQRGVVTDFATNGGGKIAFAFKDTAEGKTTGGNLLFSTNGGDTWSWLTDEGKAWENMPEGKPISSLKVLLDNSFLFSIYGIIDTSSREAGLYRMNYNGSEVILINDSLTLSRIGVSPTGEILHASGWYSSVGTSTQHGYGTYRSTDNGATWDRTSVYPSKSDTYFSSSNDGTTLASPSNLSYAVTEPMIPFYQTLRSTDGGATWTEIKEGGFSFGIAHVNYHPAGTIFAQIGSFVYYSVDQGRTWLDFSRGLPRNEGASDLAMTPNGDLFYGTFGHGVFTVERTNGVEETAATTASGFDVRESGSGIRTVHFSLAISGEVSLTLHDLLGRNITELLNTSLEAGEHRTVVELPALPGGTYLLTLKSPVGVFSEKVQLP